MTEHQERYAEKIAALLRKAESTTPEEAELLVAKAQELMTKYAIEQALIDEVEGKTRDELEIRELVFVGLFYDRKNELAWQVIRSNNCRGVFTKSEAWSQPLKVNGKLWREWYKIKVHGFRSDLERVELLNASLQIQLTSALASWWSEHPLRGVCSKSVEHRERKQFISGFAAAVGERLREAAARAAKQVGEQEAAAGRDASSVALVLRKRKDRVDEWVDEYYGKNGLRNVRRSHAPGSWDAHNAGRAAGHRADVGQPGVGGSRGSLGSGR